MFAVVYVMRVDHALQIPTPLIRAPPNALVNDNIMKNQVEYTVAKDTHTARDQVRIVCDLCGVIKQSNGRQTKNYSKPIVLFNGMIMNGMMRLVPHPKEAVHDVFMGEPDNKFPEQKCS